MPVAPGRKTGALVLHRPVVLAEHKSSVVVAEEVVLGFVDHLQRDVEHPDRIAHVGPHSIDLLDRRYLALVSHFVPLRIAVSLFALCRLPTFLESCTESSNTCNNSSTKATKEE